MMSVTEIADIINDGGKAEEQAILLSNLHAGCQLSLLQWFSERITVPQNRKKNAPPGEWIYTYDGDIEHIYDIHQLYRKYKLNTKV